MGFGFNLFVFPVLILATIGFLVYFFVTKSKAAIKILCGLWAVIILLFIVATITTNLNGPIRLTKSQIIGDYRIDKKFYKGKNADWQYEHYRFTITPTDSFYFYVMNRDSVIKTFKSKMKYYNQAPELWNLQDGSTNDYHVIKNKPTLYRGHNKFYYVFRSNIYGNLFFRKEKN